jgi:hypothetical protein
MSEREDKPVQGQAIRQLTEEERLQIIAEQHWAYTERVIMLLLQETKNLYIDAFKHGCKHGKEGRY